VVASKTQDDLPPRVKKSVEKNALLNATRHSGKAEPGVVISKVLGEFPELRQRAKVVVDAVNSVVRKINQMDPKAQKKLLLEEFGDLQVPHAEKEERTALPELPGAVKGEVVLRLPPEPSGFMHIGHAMAFTINDIYKQMYEGELWLRFEDTNPRKVEPAYYQSFRDGIKWLGITCDREKSVSQDLPAIYRHARTLIEEGDAYACACSPEKVKKYRFAGQECEHRNGSREQNISVWEGMLSRRFREGEWVIRLKGDMKNLDYSLRDPNLLRVIDHEHPLTHRDFVVWPTYDFEVVIEDEICGVTHILRSSEFHTALQDIIRRKLSFRNLVVVQFSRFNFKGTPVQKRLLRPLVEKKLVTGWDDPRMPTVQGVIRRGIVPAAIRQFTLRVGYTKSEHEYDWSLLYSVNRRLIDPGSKRLFFVPSPVKVSVDGAPNKDAAIPYHPENDLGSRTISTKGSFYLPSEDVAQLEKGDVFRLMELFNVKVLGRSKGTIKCAFAGEELTQETKKLQWVTEENIPIKVLEPSELFTEDGKFNRRSLTTTKGLAEKSFGELKIGEIIQFQRYGFCRIDSENVCVLAHR
jgi:glutamyl-tRNA synthetase